MSRVAITGGRVRIEDVRAFLRSLNEAAEKGGVKAQAVNADMIAGRNHISFAVEKALASFKNNRALARDVGMEIMLYLRGRRQIEKALEMGVKKGDNNVAIVIIGDDAERARPSIEALLDEVDGSVIDYGHKKDEGLMRMYEITPREVEIAGRDRMPLLVKERSALLEFEK